MIPDGWTPTELGALADFTSGGTPSKQNDDFWGGTFPWVSAKDLKKHVIDSAELGLTDAGKSHAKTAPIGAVLMLVRGMTLLKDVPIGYVAKPLAFNQDIKALIAKDHVDPKFLAYLLVSLKRPLMTLVNTANHGTGRLDTNLIKAFPVILPPIEEQRRIADRLATWDRTVETVEALIANARAQKQALMQQLLSGKRRLAGFSEQWEWAAFADVFERVKTKNAEGNTNVLTISAQLGLISQVEYFNKTVASDDVRGYTLLQRGDFAYNKSYSDGYPMGAIKPLDRYDSGIVSSLYICFRLTKRGFDHDFLRHFFEAGFFNREIASIAQEGARNHGLLNVSVVEFFETSLHIPKPDEQAAIARVINAAEAEEQAYEAQLTVLRQEKAALMQQLLTGKRRVKLPESEAA